MVTQQQPASMVFYKYQAPLSTKLGNIQLNWFMLLNNSCAMYTRCMTPHVLLFLLRPCHPTMRCCKVHVRLQHPDPQEPR